MQLLPFFQFAAVALASYLGLAAGFFLASLTKEELPTAMKYFPWLQRLIIIAAAAAALNFFNAAVALKIAAYQLVLLLALLLLIANLVVNKGIQFFYAAFGIMLFAVSSDKNYLLIIAALVFVFGMVSGSAYFGSNVKKKSQTVAAAGNLLTSNLLYPFIAIALFAAAN